MKSLIALAVAAAFSVTAIAQDKKAEPSTMDKVKKAGAENTANTKAAKEKQRAEADARSKANKEARDKRAAERKAKKEAKAKAKMDAKK
jgi:hypothetical protein